MKKLVILALIILPALGMAQKLNHKAADEKKNNEMLIGYCNREGFATVNSNFDSAYKAEYSVYRTDAATMKLLAGKLKGARITVVMATWCGDSKDWIPRFYKVLDELNFNYKRLTLICVDRSRKAPGTMVETLNVDRVPTFIFYRKKVELGRIVEVPADLLEKDMLKILSK
ncbi:MAG: thioredoxin family protein [Bacteroidota bacterium]